MTIERSIIALACLMLAVCAPARGAGVPAEAQQLVLVVTADWNANQGVLHTFERSGEGWRTRDRGIQVAIGRAGAAWGIGLHEPQPGPQKSEGDGRSPAGVFAIGTAFGYAQRERADIGYRAMTEFDYCIDVNGSPHYNRIVDARVVGREAVERSTEPMRRDIHVQGDQRYKLGFVIEHNPGNATAKGSCIFAHLWATLGQTTAGCTAMNERQMRDLLAWLEQDRRPVFALLPYAEYRRLQVEWNLPGEVASPK
jgi:L,D-peptidoglycan transpeptidase YkuD (ErfK/YbiS/YcfS/YnhG family)